MKHVENTLAQVGELRAKRQQQALAKFGDLVRDLADGKQRKSAEDVDGVLLEAGRTPEHLADAVRLLLKRRELEKLAAELPAREKRARELKEALTNLDAAQEQIRTQLGEERKAHVEELGQARYEWQEAARAVVQLRDGKQKRGTVVRINERGLVEEVDADAETLGDFARASVA